jgi:hypothetical protein
MITESPPPTIIRKFYLKMVNHSYLVSFKDLILSSIMTTTAPQTNAG